MNDPAFDGIAGFIDAFVDDPSIEGLDAALARFPEAPARLVTYFESRFVDGVELSGIEESQSWWTMLSILASKWTPADKQSFLTQVGLLAAPNGYRWLADFFRGAFAVSEIEPWLLAGLEGDDFGQREAASHLAYHLFDGTPDYALSAAGQARLEAAENRG